MPRITVHLPDGEELIFPLHKDNGEDFHLRVGRLPDNDIVIPITSVSSSHAVLSKAPYGYVLRDSGSTNGLIVNGVREDSVVLSPGVSVLLGEASLSYDLEPGEGREEAVAAGHDDLPAADHDEDMEPAEVEPLKYDEDSDEDDDEEVKTVRVVSKTYILIVIVYTLVIFALSFGAGVIYKHYSDTGELPFYRWFGIESPKEKIASELEAQKRAAGE